MQHGSREEILAMFAKLHREIKLLLKEIARISYFMRGSVQYDSLMEKCYTERQIMADLIEERLEAESKNPHPVY